MVITFAEISIGLICIGQKNPFGIAAGIATKVKNVLLYVFFFNGFANMSNKRIERTVRVVDAPAIS